MTAILSAARRLSELGLAIHWLRAPPRAPCGWPAGPCQSSGKIGKCECSGKAPIAKAWSAAPYLPPDRIAEGYRPGANLGVHCGLVAGAPCPVIVVDLDSEPALLWGRAHLPPTPWRTLTGRLLANGEPGEHWYYRHPGGTLPNKAKTTTPQGVKLALDLRGDGGQVVVAPSIHPSGRAYQEADLWLPRDLPLFDPAWVEAPRQAPTARRAPQRRADASQVEKRARAYLAGMPAAVAGQDGSGQTLHAAASLTRGFCLDEGTAFSLLSSDYNPRCSPPWDDADLRRKVAESMKLSRLPADGWLRDAERPQKPAEWAPHPNAPGWDDASLPRDGRGRIVAAPESISAILGQHPDWAGVLRLNQFSGAIECSRVPPWHPDDAPQQAAVGEWQDNDTLRAAAWISRRYGAQGLRPSKVAVEDAVQLVADRAGYHPVRDYLRALQWDGVPRLGTWLADYFGADQTEYTALVGRLWLISAVARVMRPGCVAKYSLVLEGAQDLGKSSAIRALGGRWTRDTPLDLDSKDAYTGLRGAWIVELAELDGLSRHESARVKSFLSSPEDRFRPPYGRRDVTVLRQNVFVGTINPGPDGRYLKDPTGGVRFWPVPCTCADVAALTSVRDQLWAEAALAYAQGARWWPEGAENALCTAEQALRAVEDDRVPLVAAWLDSPPGLALRASNSLTTAAIALGALGIPAERFGRGEQTAVGQIMQAVGGWERVRQGGSGRGWVYRRVA